MTGQVVSLKGGWISLGCDASQVGLALGRIVSQQKTGLPRAAAGHRHRDTIFGQSSLATIDRVDCARYDRLLCISPMLGLTVPWIDV